MLLLLVLAMVRPAIRSFIAGRSARNLIVVLDCSPSMLASVKGAAASSASSFLQARGKAVELLSSAGPRDHVAYIEAGAPAKIVSPLTADAARVVDEARRSRISYGGGGGVAQAIVKAAMMLATRKEVLSEVYVLTDMAATSLTAGTNATGRLWRKCNSGLGTASSCISWTSPLARPTTWGSLM